MELPRYIAEEDTEKAVIGSAIFAAKHHSLLDGIKTKRVGTPVLHRASFVHSQISKVMLSNCPVYKCRNLEKIQLNGAACFIK